MQMRSSNHNPLQFKILFLFGCCCFFFCFSAIAFISIHLYNKYEWEKSQIKDYSIDCFCISSVICSPIALSFNLKLKKNQIKKLVKCLAELEIRVRKFDKFMLLNISMMKYRVETEWYKKKRNNLYCDRE